MNMTKQALTVRSITLYYQAAAETGDNSGWAYNVIHTDKDGYPEHTSEGFEIGEDDDGGESLSDVRAAFAVAWPEAASQIAKWTPNPQGGWTGLPEMAPGWEDRAVERAKREGVI